MQFGSCFLALGGSSDHIVPKDVTPAEVAVLRAIHGPDAVTNVRPAGDAKSDRIKNKDGEYVKRTDVEELQRLAATYGRAKDVDGNSHVATLFPRTAMGSGVPQSFSDLQLDKSYYAPKDYVDPDEEIDETEKDPVDSMNKAQLLDEAARLEIEEAKPALKVDELRTLIKAKRGASENPLD